jgi:hypothetical protein
VWCLRKGTALSKSSSEVTVRWLLRMGVLIAASGIVVPSAIAQSAADKAAAQARLDEGLRLGKQGDYAGALRQFQDAFSRYPSPKIYFNVGQAYRGLARDVDAIESFERFLAEAKDAPPTLRAEAQRQVEELLPMVASVKIACDTDGAEVSIDGRRYGVTPLPAPILVAPGPHQVFVEKAGAAPYTARIDLRRGVVRPIDVRLAAASAPTSPQSAPPAGVPPAASLKVPPPPDASLVTATPAPNAPLAAKDRPVYTRWWFWTAAAAVAAGAVAVAIVAGQGKTDNCLGVADCYGVK